MKKNIKIISACLFLVCLISVFTACKAKTVMRYEDKTLSVNVYEFLLSRMKGTLAYYGYEVGKDSFWNTVTDMNGTTYDDYFCQTIKTQAMNYIVADKMFDEQGLEFGEVQEARIDELMDAYVKRAGSKSELNAELKEFGVNYDILRDIYVLEAKIELLKEHLYGKDGEKISSADKKEYFNENYVAFRQIFLATYEYVIDEDGDKIIQGLDDEKKAELHDRAKQYAKECDGDINLFEEYIGLYDESENNSVIYLYSSAGYYAAQNDSVAYFDEIAEKLSGLEVGELTVYPSDYGYHVICKYENEPGAYDKEENKDIFETFTDDLISTLFEDMCRKLYDGVTVDSTVFGDAPTMKEVGINTKY